MTITLSRLAEFFRIKQKSIVSVSRYKLYITADLTYCLDTNARILDISKAIGLSEEETGAFIVNSNFGRRPLTMVKDYVSFKEACMLEKALKDFPEITISLSSVIKA